MFPKLVFITLLLSVSIYFVESYKVLVVCPMPSRSHNNLGKGIADILHDAEHEVTFITGVSSKRPRYRELAVDLSSIPLNEMYSFQTLSTNSQLETLKMVSKLISGIMNSTFTNEKIKKMLNDNEENFDLVIIEYVMLNHAFTGLGVKYDCPVIMVSPMSLLQCLARLTGNPISVATVPNVILGITGEMSFVQRLTNTALTILQEAFGIFYADGFQKEIYERYLPNEAARVPYSKLYEKIALTFTNSHPSMGAVRPLLPNVVEIGGYFITDNKTLPNEYKKILDNSKNGVVFFSMGSNLKSADMPDQLKSDILSALGKRKETILWKYEEDLPQKPKNVIIRRWMPQASILSHPNVRLFITHGGMLSTIEATAAGVPVLSIPIFGDQFANSKITQDKGCGITLTFSNITVESFTWALNEVLGNPKYTETAKKANKLYHDRLVSAKTLVSFYSEHVIRTGGAKHLSLPILPLYSSLLLDIIAVLAIVFTLLAAIIIRLSKMCCGQSKGRRKRKNE